MPHSTFSIELLRSANHSGVLHSLNERGQAHENRLLRAKLVSEVPVATMPVEIGEYKILESRLKILLPEEYQDSCEDVQPVSMGSAGLKFAADGSVLWDEIWRSFCDLAMAGGPPHRGTLLEPGTEESIDQYPEVHLKVVTELCRGVGMVSGLAAGCSVVPGWIRVDCPSSQMAGWLARAITMENVSAHVDRWVLHLPAGPHFRLEKEIKNVITSIAKTCHYWLGHTSIGHHVAIRELFEVMDLESPLLQPPFSSDDSSPVSVVSLSDSVAANIHAKTGLSSGGAQYHGWLGIDCLSVQGAIWMMRIMIASNALCRREGNSIYVPINPRTDANGYRIAELVIRAHRVALAQRLL